MAAQSVNFTSLPVAFQFPLLNAISALDKIVQINIALLRDCYLVK